MKKIGNTLLQYRMHEPGRNLGQRLEHKPPLRHGRMRQREPWLENHSILHLQEIEIKRTGALGAARVALPPEILLDREQPLQQIHRFERCPNRCRGIQEQCLLRIGNRLSLVDRRDGEHAAQFREPSNRLPQGLCRIAIPRRKVRSQRNIRYRAHDCFPFPAHDVCTRKRQIHPSPAVLLYKKNRFMRIAFFGGTFDPPHRGHLALAREAIHRLKLDQVTLAPVAVQPLKPDGAQASFADRMAMVRLAAADDARLAVSDVDGPREDGCPNYTIDTITRFQAGLPAGSRLFFLTGADALYSLRRWQRPVDLLLGCDWILAGRPDFPLDQLPALLPEGISAGQQKAEDQVTTVELTGPAARTSELYLLTGFNFDISATEIRRALAVGEEPRSTLAPGVLAYIRKHNLYDERNTRETVQA